MGKIKKGITKELHKKEILARKTLANKREGNYYMKIDNDSSCGRTYTNTIGVHQFGKLELKGYINPCWEFLVNKAKSRLEGGR